MTARAREVPDVGQRLDAVLLEQRDEGVEAAGRVADGPQGLGPGRVPWRFCSARHVRLCPERAISIRARTRGGRRRRWSKIVRGADRPRCAMVASIHRPRNRIVLVACLLACGGVWTLAVAGRFDTPHRETVTDPTRSYLPGKYYERAALEAMRRQDYRSALDDYTRAAYWGNKVAQYNLGEIYFQGMGNIPADPARGVAWLGIAAEAHQPDYGKALVGAYKSLSPEERRRADGIWKALQAKYGDRLTLARATLAFEHAYHSDRVESATTEDDPDTYTFRIGGYDPAGNIRDEADLISDLNELDMQNGVTSRKGFWAARKQEFASFVTSQFGRVEIGPIQPIGSAKPAR